MPWQNLSALCHLVHGSDLNYGVDVHLLRQAGMIHPGLGYHRRARLDLSLIRLEYHGIQVWEVSTMNTLLKFYPV